MRRTQRSTPRYSAEAADVEKRQTFYSDYFNKVTDCGCFGDAIPLTPWESFSKDVVLSVLIALLIWGRDQLKPWLPIRWNQAKMAGGLGVRGLFNKKEVSQGANWDFRG